jgi:multidrug efflux pump subunit AcrA (membrane-fusion protein)
MARSTPLTRGGACGEGATSAHAASLPADMPEVPLHDVTTAMTRRLTRHVREPAWLETVDVVSALLYEEEAAVLRTGDRGLFVPADGSRAGIDVRVADAAGSERSGPTTKLRFDMTAPIDGLRPAQAGWIDLGDRSLDVLVVASEAILKSPAGPYVLTVSADGRTLTRKDVRIGGAEGRFAVVQAGLDEGARVVGMDAFFFDTERRWREPDCAGPPGGLP